MSRIYYLIVFLICHCLTATLTGAVLEDFNFNDANGTLLGAAANDINPTNLWTEDTADMDNSSVQNGVYRIQKASAISPPNGFGQNFIDMANVTSGQVWLVAEIAGWHFASGTSNPADFDPNELEEIRFAFLDNDTGTSGSTVTSEVEIERNAAGGIEIHGVALGAGMNIPAQPLSLSQNDLFTVVLGLDKTANTYSIHTKNGAGPFALLGTMDVDPVRNGNSVRFVANNSFAGAGEFFDVGRIYLTDVNPVPEPSTLFMTALAGTMLLGRRWRT